MPQQSTPRVVIKKSKAVAVEGLGGDPWGEAMEPPPVAEEERIPTTKKGGDHV